MGRRIDVVHWHNKGTPPDPWAGVKQFLLCVAVMVALCLGLTYAVDRWGFAAFFAFLGVVFLVTWLTDTGTNEKTP